MSLIDAPVKLRPLFLFCLVGAMELAAATAAAQAPSPRPTITRAVDIIESFNPDMSVGTRAVFTRRNSPAAKMAVSMGLQVRVFPLRPSEDRPTPLTSVDNCHVYNTEVYPLIPESGSQLTYATLDESWLSLSSSGKSLQSGRFFLVFEVSGASAREFRLRSTDAAAYFKTGLAIRVTPDARITVDAVDAKLSTRQAIVVSLLEAARAGNTATPCYTYSAVPVQAGSGHIDSLNALSDGPPLQIQEVQRLTSDERTSSFTSGVVLGHCHE